MSHDRHFEVVIKSTGRVIRVEAAQPVIHALAAAGIDIPTSCEQGVCGTCLTRVLEGELPRNVENREVIPRWQERFGARG